MAYPDRNFLDIYAHNFVRVAIAVPCLQLAAPSENTAEILRLYGRAAAEGAALVLFPEMCISGYSLDDLHQQDALLQAVLEGLKRLIDATSSNPALLIAGAPLRFEGRLFNCAVILSSGKILGIVPKTYIPNYREFYEKRQFAGSRDALFHQVNCLGQEVPFGVDLIFRDQKNPDFSGFLCACGNLRRRVGADPSVDLRRLTGRDCLGQSLRLQYHNRQSRLSPPTGPGTLCQDVVRLSVFRGRVRGIHNGSGVGRPCHCL